MVYLASMIANLHVFCLLCLTNASDKTRVEMVMSHEYHCSCSSKTVGLDQSKCELAASDHNRTIPGFQFVFFLLECFTSIYSWLQLRYFLPSTKIR